MSDSSIAASTCIWRRSCAIENSVGVLRLAATVCPASTWREMTMPSTGAMIDVRDRSTRAPASGRLALLDDRRGVGDLRLAGPDLRFRRGHRLGGGVVGEPRLVALGAGDEALGEQRLLAVEVVLRIVGLDPRPRRLRAQRQQVGLLVEELGPRCFEIGLGLAHLELEGLRVDAREELALLHLAVEVDEQLLDLARDLRTDENRGDRGQRARSRDDGGDVAALDLGKAVRRVAGCGAERLPGDAGSGRECQHRQGDQEAALRPLRGCGKGRRGRA